jgi:hypothetical protein
VDITVYLPDEIGARAKREQLKLSRLLRDAVQTELDRRDALHALLGEPQIYEVDLMTEEERRYTGRITGKLVVEVAGYRLFVTEDQRFLVVVEDEYEYEELHGGVRAAVERLAGWLADAPDEFILACERIGAKPVIDL